MYKQGKGRVMKVRCTTTNQEFYSQREAARFFGIEPNLVGRAIKLQKPTHGLRFEKTL